MNPWTQIGDSLWSISRLVASRDTSKRTATCLPENRTRSGGATALSCTFLDVLSIPKMDTSASRPTNCDTAPFAEFAWSVIWNGWVDIYNPIVNTFGKAQ